MRIRIDLAYDGTDFNGWAIQPGLRTVQGLLEGSLATVLRLPRARVVCAGRTDTGVHARGQVVHLDLDPGALARSVGRSTQPPTVALRSRLNGILPADLRVRRVAEAAEGFDARYSAMWRRYAYRVADDPASVDPLARHQVLVWRRQLDLDAMNEASAGLLGLRDFASFCKRREGATTIRSLLELSWTRDEYGVVLGTVRADAFCRSMVRSIVGCLLAIGDGRQPVGWAAELLDGARRDPDMSVAHARGLTLEEVGYPDDDGVAAQAQVTRTRRRMS